MTTQAERELVALRWWTLPTGEVIGVVALVDRQHGYWKAYIGLGSGASQLADMASIANWGAHAGEEVARALAGARFDDLHFEAT